MLSDFIINHPEMPLFFLTDEEWDVATRNESDLLESSKLNFLDK
jgi:hypothetical protein